MGLLKKIAAADPEAAKQIMQVLQQNAPLIQPQLLETQSTEVVEPLSDQTPLVRFLEEAIRSEQQSMLTYLCMAGLVRGLYRGVLAEEFEDHAEEEQEHLGQFLLYYTSLNGGTMPPIVVDVPAIPITSPMEMLTILANQERQAIKTYKIGLEHAEQAKMVGLRVTLENIIEKETEHLNDLTALCGGPEAPCGPGGDAK